MTLSEVKTMLESITGFATKVTYYAWPKDDAPALPFICYFSPEVDNFGADNEVYYSVKQVIVELYSNHRDLNSEEAIEAVFASNKVFWDKSSEYLTDEKCYMTSYEIEV